MISGAMQQLDAGTGLLRPGQLVLSGAYRVAASDAEEEGLGGPGFRGERVSDGRPVLITALTALSGAPVAQMEALAGDVALLSRLRSRHLLLVHCLGREAGPPLLVADAASGPTLRQMLDKKRRSQGQPLSWKGASNILDQVCAGLLQLHGVVPHGLLCPETIEVDAGGTVRLLALALCRLVSAAQLGERYPESAGCLAPERRGGGLPSVSADVYAAGAVLYMAVTGRPVPPGGSDDSAYVPPRQAVAELPSFLDDLLGCCLAADPGARYPGAQALREAIALVASGQTGPRSFLSFPTINTPNPKANMADDARKGTPPGPPGLPGMPGLSSGGAAPGPAPNPPPRTSGPQAQVPRAPAFPVAPPSLRASGGGQADEDQERWLVQKEDKMDYGPFPLREVRSQIERGTINADHVILDMETGDRRRVREHPLLAELSREWEAKHAQLNLELKDRADRDKHRASVQKTLSGIFIVVLLVGAGVGGYFKFVYKPEVKTVVVKEQSSDDFFKGISISMNVDPPVKKAHTGGKKRGPKNGAFDSATSMDASEEGADETLSGTQVNDVMSRNFKLLGGCLRDEATRNPGVKKLDVEFLIRGSSGKVFSVKVNGETGSEVAGCVFGKMQTVDFPKFNGQKTHATFSLALK